MPAAVRDTKPLDDSVLSPCNSVPSVRVIVPDDVIGEPDTDNPVDPDTATEVTVPPAPFHAVPLLYSRPLVSVL